MTLGFVINTYRDTAALSNCLESIRKHYPEAPLVVIDDGGRCPDLSSATAAHTTSLIRGDHLRCQVGAWLQRWFEAGLSLGTKAFVKMDPDSMLHRKFNRVPTAPAFGALVPFPFGEYLHGGCKGFSRECAAEITWGARLKHAAGAAPPETLVHMRGRYGISEDIMLSWLLSSWGIQQENWKEVAICPLSPKHGYAATHGHKRVNTPV